MKLKRFEQPWRVKYRRREAGSTISTATLKQPNAYLNVNENGLYEITEVHDSQCPGTVYEDASTYEVNWIRRPFATLSERTKSVYQEHNKSSILPPICQGVSDHVDLDLTGIVPQSWYRPFSLMILYQADLLLR